MRARLLTVVLSLSLVAGLAAFTSQQQAAEPQTIADCLKAAREYVSVKYRAARAAGEQPNIQALNQQKVEVARGYAARFPVDRVEGRDLPLLAQLLIEANDATGAKAAVTRRLAMPALNDAEKAEALLAGVGIGFAPPISDAGLAIAEDYTRQLDRLKPAALDQRLDAHNRLGSYYRGADVDDKIFEHMSAVLDLAATLPPEKKKALGFRLVNAYTSLAEVHGDRGEADKAVAVLKRGLTDLAAVAEAQKYIPGVIDRYSLVGKRAGVVEAPYWLNADPGTKSIDPVGKVSLVQFTAHWCGPCRKSYPAMVRLHDRFAASGLQIIFSTQFYGFFEQRRPLSVEDELAADREYFLGHYKIPFKVAIEPQKPMPGPQDTAPAAGARTWSEDRYFVSGIPQMAIVDKKGIVRLIMVGWDPTNEPRIAKLFEGLVGE